MAAKSSDVKILVVDDSRPNREKLGEMLRSLGYQVIPAGSGEEALMRLIQSPDLVFLDLTLPGTGCFEVIRRTRLNESTAHVPIVVLGDVGGRREMLRALELGANDFLRKPFDAVELIARVRSLLALKSYGDMAAQGKQQLEQMVRERTLELEGAYEQLVQVNDRVKRAYLETIFRLAVAAEYRDKETAAHLRRMSRYSAVIARRIGLAADEVETILYAAPMHDIGKIGVPDSILFKPSRLSEEEFDVMKSHTVIGASILSGSDSPLLQIAEQIAMTHHERFNGSGYPQGLKGERIPLCGRIVALADVFDAATTNRVYQNASPNEEILRKIVDMSGENFDPVVVKAFFGGIDEVMAVQAKYKREEEDLSGEASIKVQRDRRTTLLKF